MALPLLLLISLRGLYRSAILPTQLPPPENTQRDLGPHCPFSPAPGLRGFPQGKKTSGRKLRHLFSTVSGAELEQGTGYSFISLSPGKIPDTLCPLLISQPVTMLAFGERGHSSCPWTDTYRTTQVCQIKAAGMTQEGPEWRSLQKGASWLKENQSYQYSLCSVEVLTGNLFTLKLSHERRS